MEMTEEEIKHANVAATACVYLEAQKREVPVEILNGLAKLFAAEGKMYCKHNKGGDCELQTGIVSGLLKPCYAGSCYLVNKYGNDFRKMAESIE